MKLYIITWPWSKQFKDVELCFTRKSAIAKAGFWGQVSRAKVPVGRKGMRKKK